ncbi:hypothetical protein MAESPC_02240 [Microcystis aeruginosa SPC777]|uniref:Uncharacterized protein n=1 Tax=Microcystis aeruginosa SPC777 TaxID=482300 RepID=S3JPG7_MICAE|nr:hypothetical protein MAESPC_02240 [Microcystis aeruginosa SPC777]
MGTLYSLEKLIEWKLASIKESETSLQDLSTR